MTMVEQYFNWMYDIVCKNRFSQQISYWKLLSYLHQRQFYSIIERDHNRDLDGRYLRNRFSEDLYLSTKNEPASVLEVMIALCIRCEENIMDDPRYGDRTAQWFWQMISSLGLGGMTDERFNEDYIRGVIDKFLAREYAPNGRGGLFTIRGTFEDMRDMEIWYQLCRYLDKFS